jgi:hypothetical protein
MGFTLFPIGFSLDFGKIILQKKTEEMKKRQKLKRQNTPI